MRGKSRRITVIRLLRAVAALTVLFSLLTGFDIPYHAIELFSHFRLQYFVVSILLFLIFAYLRHVSFAALLALVAIFNASFVLPWYFGDIDTAHGQPLKLIYANVRSSNTHYSRLIAFIREEKPDMIYLQEVTDSWLEGTKELLEDYPYTYAEPRPGHFGIAAFSKIPFDSIRHVDSPPLNHPTIISSITVAGESITIISTHPTIPIGQSLFNARNEQLEGVAELVNETNGNVILLGDFNASVWCMRFRQLEHTTSLTNVRKGFGILPSWPTFLPLVMIPIDQALVSNDISVTDVRTGKRIGSDHLPLIVTVSL
jgi:endonuclease/exonuclease/phosphatase (EEP) superfamily protein YafD